MIYRVVTDLSYVDEIVDIHIDTFQGFFLTFLGRGFLKELYKGFIEHDGSNIIIAVDERIEGFLAYSNDLSNFYQYLINRRFFSFAWYGLLAALRKPKAMIRLIRAFLKPSESKREEQYMELSSIGVRPEMAGHGIGSRLIDELKKEFDADRLAYIKLETDADDNSVANAFYVKNGFMLHETYVTAEGRKMNEYRWYQQS